MLLLWVLLMEWCLTDPTLTTIEQHGHEMGQIAAKMLLRRINSYEEYETITKIIKTNLIIRESTQRDI